MSKAGIVHELRTVQHNVSTLKENEMNSGRMYRSATQLRRELPPSLSPELTHRGGTNQAQPLPQKHRIGHC